MQHKEIFLTIGGVLLLVLGVSVLSKGVEYSWNSFAQTSGMRKITYAESIQSTTAAMNGIPGVLSLGLSKIIVDKYFK